VRRGTRRAGYRRRGKRIQPAATVSVSKNGECRFPPQCLLSPSSELSSCFVTSSCIPLLAIRGALDRWWLTSLSSPGFSTRICYRPMTESLPAERMEAVTSQRPQRNTATRSLIAALEERSPKSSSSSRRAELASAYSSSADRPEAASRPHGSSSTSRSNSAAKNAQLNDLAASLAGTWCRHQSSWPNALSSPSFLAVMLRFAFR